MCSRSFALRRSYRVRRVTTSRRCAMNRSRIALGPLVGLDLHPGPHAQDAAARVVEGADGRDPQQDSAGGKVGTLDAAGQRSPELRIEKLPERRVRMVDQVGDALDGLAEIVR